MSEKEEATEQVTETTESTEAPESTETAEATETSETTETTGEPESITEALEAAKADDTSEQSTETTADSEETTADTDGESDDETEPPAGAPEKYTAFEVPDGFAWSDEAESHWADKMKESNVSQEDAQVLLDIMADQSEKFGTPDLQKRQDTAFAAQKKAGLETIKKDPAIIGEKGDEFKASMNLASKALDQYCGTDKVGMSRRARLVAKGYLDDPDLAHVFVGVGKGMSSDSLDAPGDPGMDTSYDDLPASERMGWDDNAEPIRE